MRARTRSHEKSENNQFVFSWYKFQAIRQLTLDFSFNSDYLYKVCCCLFHVPSRLADDEIIPDNVDRFIYIQGARILLKKGGFAVIIYPDHKEGALTKRLLKRFRFLRLSAFALVLQRPRRRANVTKTWCLRFEWWVSSPYMEKLSIIGFRRHFENKRELFNIFKTVRSKRFLCTSLRTIPPFANLAASSDFLQDREFR